MHTILIGIIVKGEDVMIRANAKVLKHTSINMCTCYTCRLCCAHYKMLSAPNICIF